MTVWVYAESRGGGVPIPVEGATIAFDPPGGAEREEVTSDATGKAIVHGDFAKGSGVLSAHKKDFQCVTTLDVSPANFEKLPFPPVLGKPKSEAVLILQWVDPIKDPSLVETSGGFKNRTETGTGANVSSGIGGVGYEGPANAPFSIRVPKDKAHFIYGFEFKNVSPPPNIENKLFKFFRVDRPAQGGGATTDIDLAAQAALPVTTVKQKIEIPGGATGPFAGNNVFSFTRGFMSDLIVAPIQKVTVNADSADVENALPQTDFGETLLTFAAFVGPTDGSQSARVEEGLPVEGRVFKDFLPITPLAIEKQKLSDPLPTEGFPAGPTTDLVLDIQSNVKTVWIVFRAPFAAPNQNAGTPFTLPKPPSSFTVPASLQARIVARRDFNPIGTNGFGYAKAISVSRTLNLEK